MTKQLAFLPLAALVMSGCVFNAEPKRAGAKLTAPSAPFKADAAAPSKSGTFRPELKGNRVIAGDKVLELTHDGLLKYYAAGRIIGNIYLPFVIVEKNKAKKNQWLCTDVNLPRENFDLHECGMINKDGRDVYRKVIVKDGKKAECLTSFALSTDGKASLSYAWTQFDSKDFSLQPSALIFNIPTASIRSTTVNIDGVGKLIPENTPAELFHSPGFKEAELFAGSPEKSIKILSSSTCVEFYVDARDLDTLVRVYPKAGQNQLTVSFDISRGVVGGVKSAQTYAGIDFMAIENLEMPDINSSRNLLANSSFEQGLSSYWQIPAANYSGPGTWKETPFVIDDRSAKTGHHSLKLAAKENILKGSLDVRGITPFVYQFRTFAIPLERGKYTFSFYAKGEPGDAQRVGVWFPNAAWIGNSFTSIPGAQQIFAVSPEWTRYALTFDVPASMPVSAAIGADSKSGKSHVWLDGLQLEQGDKASAFISRPAEGKLVTVKADNFLEDGANIGAVLEIYSKPEAIGKVKLSVKDFFNEKHFNGEYGFKCDKDGKARLPLPFDGKFNRGVFILKAEYELSDGTKNYDFHRFSLMTPLENKHRLKNIFADNYGAAEQRCDFLKMLERYKQIGIGAKTHVQNWDKEISDAYRECGVEPFNAVMVSLIFGKWGEGGRPLIGFALCDDAAKYAVKPDDPSVLIKDFHLDGNGELTGEYLAKFKNAVANSKLTSN